MIKFIKKLFKKQPEEDNIVCTPYYTWKECKYCHIVRPLNWEECDCRKKFK